MSPSRDFPELPEIGYMLVDEASPMGARKSAMAVGVAGARRLFPREEYHRIPDVRLSLAEIFA